MNYESVCYKRNFLSHVIVRLDFLNPLEELNQKIPNDLSRIITKSFPIIEPQESIGSEFEFSVQKGVKEKRRIKDLEWIFFSNSRDKKLSLDWKHLYIDYLKYEKYEFLRDDFETVLKALLNKYPDLNGNRLGLRFINEFKLEEENSFEWDEYFDERLLKSFDFNEDKSILSRNLGTIEYNLSKFKLRLVYGMYNPDFPSPIKKKIFTLDFDAYFTGLIEANEVMLNLDDYHNRIQELFEKIIKKKMRETLDG